MGQVLHVSSTHHMILKANVLPRLNSKVVDENLKTIGKVFDVFGPLSSPYVAIRPLVPEPQHLVGKILYMISTKKGRERRKREG